MKEEESYEFVDEVLPILRINDLLSVDEMAAIDPSFIGMTDNDVLNYVYDFFPRPDKARGLSKLWCTLVEKDDTNVFNNWIPLVNNLRRGSFDDIEQQELTYNRIIGISDVHQRKQELERFAFPYVTDELNLKPINSLQLRELKLPRELLTVNGDSFYITKFDAKYHGIRNISLAGVREHAAHLDTGFLADIKRSKQEAEEVRDVLFTTDHTWMQTARHAERSRRKQILAMAANENEVENFDVERMYRFLSKHGINTTTLTAKEMHGLVQSWHPEPRPSYTKRAISSHEDPQPLKVTVRFFDAVQTAADALNPGDDTADIIGKIERRLTGLDASISPMSILPSPLNPQTLVEALDGNEESLESFVNAYRDFVKSEEKQAARAALESAKHAFEQSETWNELIASVRQHFEKTEKSVLHTVGKLDSTFPAYSDEKEATAGDDVSGYSGSTLTIALLEPTYEQQGADDADVADVVDAENGADAMEEDGNQDENAKPDWGTEGQKEVFTVVIKMLKEIHKKTRLPFEKDTIVSLSLPHVACSTKMAMLEGMLPDIPKEQLEMLLTDSTQAEWYDSPVVKKALVDVNDTFKEACIQALSCCLATWVVILQESFADRMLLNYKPPPSMTPCANMWGFHGPPMTRTKGRGTLMYLLCSLTEFLPSALRDFLEPTVEHRVATIGEVAEQMHPERVASLKVRFEDLKPVLLAQKEALKKEQADLKKFLEGNGTVERLVSGLLQLPKIMAQSADNILTFKTRKGACCSQQLGSDFRAYADWKFNRALKGLLSQMKSLSAHQGLLTKDASTGLTIVQSPKTAEKDVRKKTQLLAQPSCSIVNSANQVETTDFKVFEDAWSKWIPPVSKANTQRYIESRLELIARGTKQPRAFSSWMESLNVATLPDLARLGNRIAGEEAATLYNMRGCLIKESDEQRVLDMARIMIVTWASQSPDKYTESASHLSRFSQPMQSAVALNNKISELRERQKAAMLNKLNSKDPEMRKLLTQMNRLGVVNIRANVGADAGVDAVDAEYPDTEYQDVAEGGEQPVPTEEALAEQEYAWRGEDADPMADALDA